MAKSTRPQRRTFARHLASKQNLRPSLAPMTPEHRERAKTLPRLGAAAPSNSPLLGNK